MKPIHPRQAIKLLEESAITLDHPKLYNTLIDFMFTLGYFDAVRVLEKFRDAHNQPQTESNSS